MTDERDGVLGGLEPFEWDDVVAARCEIAVEEVNQVVGGYAALLWQARHNRAAYSATDVAAWEAQQTAFIARRRALRPTDPAFIDETRQAAAEALAYLRQFRG
ncbi:conserved hypothetical protein [Frankia canadensis]|uniref:Uncharacterized protein n=1 Tax=Frankia canadensis TaxID=1836972 RepID=A0A2I2KQT2_9ACTN|nr:hypothetical protein [Frankia canadensis]SNQ48028.1 conserved hypothetical protein [Frankia canadensis]SOU55318.1 conserved hypothetical protein [Frankia canadensis]